MTVLWLWEAIKRARSDSRILNEKYAVYGCKMVAGLIKQKHDACDCVITIVTFFLTKFVFIWYCFNVWQLKYQMNHGRNCRILVWKVVQNLISRRDALGRPSASSLQTLISVDDNCSSQNALILMIYHWSMTTSPTPSADALSIRTKW